jgi:hypothetical protein
LFAAVLGPAAFAALTFVAAFARAGVGGLGVGFAELFHGGLA